MNMINLIIITDSYLFIFCLLSYFAIIATSGTSRPRFTLLNTSSEIQSLETAVVSSYSCEDVWAYATSCAVLWWTTEADGRCQRIRRTFIHKMDGKLNEREFENEANHEIPEIWHTCTLAMYVLRVSNNSRGKYL